MSRKQARLVEPVVIPRHNHNWVLKADKPFARAWSPALEAFGITEDEFLEFIDGLNLGTRAKQSKVNKAWDALSDVGGLVGSLAFLDPSGVTKIVGHSIKGVALIGGTVFKRGPDVIKIRYLKRANETFFRPKGLSVQIVDTKTLRIELGLRPDAPLVLPLDQATLSMGQKEKCEIQSASYYTEANSEWLLVRDLDRTSIKPGETYTASGLYGGRTIYNGEFRDGKPHGKGILTDPEAATYTGEITNGKKHGQGCIKYSTGAYLTGSFVDGEQDGLCTVYNPDGSRFSGGYKAGKRQGPGVVSWADGRFEKVEYQEGKANGISTYGDIKGGIWYTMVRDGKAIGNRIQITDGELLTEVSEGYTWQGGVKNGKPQGYGTAKWPSTGLSYVGFWDGGGAHGWGAFTNKEGDRETRDRNHGTMEVVRGSFSKSNGYFWIGEWYGEKRTGDGAARFTNGDQYVGKFVDGIPNGEGKYIWKDGDIDTGVFSNGSLNGIGKRVRKDLFIYTGGFQNSQFHGYGVWYSDKFAARLEAMFQRGIPRASGASWQGRERVPAEFKV